MKRTMILALSALLVFGALALPAQAGKKKVKPQNVTFHLHGTDKVGDTEYATVGAMMKMDTEVGADEKSRFVTNYVAGPNTACSGNALLPSWRGEISGKIVGDLKIKLQTVATPAAEMSVDVFADGNGSCGSTIPGQESEAPEPTATAIVTPNPAGLTEVVFEDVNFKTIAGLVMQLSIVPVAENRSPHQVRVFYDSEASGSVIELTCLPAKGSKSCV